MGALFVRNKMFFTTFHFLIFLQYGFLFNNYIKCILDFFVIVFMFLFPLLFIF